MSNLASASFKFPRSLRIIKSANYGVLVHTRDENTFRLTSKYFSVNAMKSTGRVHTLRFGITVGKKNAHRSVDRALVKRILREAARKQAPALIYLLNEKSLGLDVSLRLRAPLKSVSGHEQGVTAMKANLQSDVEQLMQALLRRVSCLKGSCSES